jgi:hypothetical protein
MLSGSDGQEPTAEARAKLEDTFSEQFVRGTIDRGALASAIDEAVLSFPEAQRAEVRAHIDQVIDAGEQLASQMSLEERAQVAGPERLGTTSEALGGWGWSRGFGRGVRGGFGRGFRGDFDCDWDDPWCGRFGRRGWFW